MRTAEEIIKDKTDWLADYLHEDDVIEAINEARKEAIEECAEKSKVKGHWYNGEFIHGSPPSVNKESILSLINELK